MIGICENCKEEKELKDIEGKLLCEGCARDIVRCDYCRKLISLSFDELEDNFGRLSIPELKLPDKQTSLVFCNLDCLEGYLKKYRQELKERDRKCGC